MTEEILGLVAELATRSRAHDEVCLDKLELTRVEAKALWKLLPGESLPVAALAERLGTDPSNLSSALDLLEERGVVARRQAPHDRRVRSVRLTPAGERLRARLVACLLDEPPAVAGLSQAERKQLRDLLRRLVS